MQAPILEKGKRSECPVAYFERLAMLARNRIYRMAFCSVGNTSDAEDITRV